MRDKRTPKDVCGEAAMHFDILLPCRHLCHSILVTWLAIWFFSRVRLFVTIMCA